MIILPQIYLLASKPALNRYRNCPHGNIPELFNLGSFLDIFFHKAVNCHVRYTHSLHTLDPKQFSIATPKKEIPAYLWIFDPIDGVDPSSKHIISYMYDGITSIKYIVEAEGCIIPDVKNVKNTRKGRQREVWGSKDTNHGIKRVRMLADDDYSTILNKNCTKMHMAQRECRLSYHSSCLIVIM